MEYQRIKDFPNYYITEFGWVMNSRGKYISWGTNGFYPKVVLYDNGRRKDKYIHRLVALAYIPNPKGKEQVNHIDGNRENNHVDNLEWVTPSENQKHSYTNGLNSRAGTNNGRAKLNEGQVSAIKMLLKRGATPTNVAKNYSVSIEAIRSIKRGATWKHVTI